MAAHFQVLAIGAPCLASPPLATSLYWHQSTGHLLLPPLPGPFQHQHNLAPKFPQLITRIFVSPYHQRHWSTYWPPILKAGRERNTGSIVFLLSSFSFFCLSFVFLLSSSDCCERTNESNEAWRPRRSGLRRPLWCLAPAPPPLPQTSVLSTVSFFCFNFATGSDRGRNDEMLDSQNLRCYWDGSENGSRNPNVYTNPPNWDTNTAAAGRVSVFTGAKGGGKAGMKVGFGC